jgi:hypothetical protein
MNAAVHMSTLYPLLPEIVLGLGAMALLMLGAYGDARTARVIDGLAIALLTILPASSKFWPWPARPPPSPCRSITPSMKGSSASNMRC